MAFRLAPVHFEWLLFHSAHVRIRAGDDGGALQQAQAIAPPPPGRLGAVPVALAHAVAGLPGEARQAAAEIAASAAPIRLADVRHSQRHRDPARVDDVIAAMRAAGMPE
jgi:hypothetical protein